MVYQKGGSYYGMWKSGQMHGHGIKTFSNGESHEGEFERGRLVGNYVHRNARGQILGTKHASNSK